MYQCVDHDYRFGHYTTWFLRVYFVDCANEDCDYYRQLGTLFRWRRRPSQKKRK